MSVRRRASGRVHYNYFRDYDPAVGRYVESDPIGLRGGTYSTFTYVFGSPLAYSDELGLGEWDAAVFGIGPIDAWTASSMSGIAQAETRRRMRNNELTQWRNGPADAFRHCLWLCLMTQTIGYDQAYEIGENHEKEGEKVGQPPEENLMDRLNNFIGQQCGLENDSLDCSARCKRRYVTGQLFGLGGVRFPRPPRPHR